MLSHLPDAVAEEVSVSITQYAYIDTKPSLPLDTITEIKPPDPEQEVKPPDPEQEVKQEIKQEEVKPAAPADERIRVVEGFGHKTYYISGIPVHFPFQPYPSQLGMMSHMIRALNGAQNTMVESPTGSGKSLALLCAVLAWRRSFEAKCRQTKANVQQTIRRYSEHNSMGFAKMLYDVKYGNSGTDQTALPAVEHAKPVDSIALRYDDDPGYSSSDLFADDLYQIIPGAKPLLWIEPTESDSDDDPANALPTPSTYTAPPSALVASHEDLLKLALSLLPETAQFILDQSEEAPPAGLDSADIDEMRDYIQISAPVNGMPKIYFGTRTHKQVSQLVDELRRKTPYRLRSAVLGSRAQTCINKRARKAQSIDDKCRQLVDDNWCGPHRAYRKLMMHEKLQPMSELELWDLEDIGKLGKQTSACPYFAARELSTEADLIFCPYQYILDPGVRSSVGIDLKGNIVILDEAHNVENAARDSGSWEITDEHLNVIAMECRKLAQRGTLVAQHNTVETLATTLINWLQGSSHPYEYLEFDSQTAVWPNSDESLDALLERIMLSPDLVAKLAMAVSTIEAHIKIIRQNREKRKPWDDEDYDSYPPEMDDIVEEDSRHLSTGSMRLLEQLLRVLGHLAPNSPFRQDYRVACIRKSNSQTLAAESVATAGPKHAPRKKLKTSPLSDSPPPPNCINALAFWALNPGVVFSEIAAKARSIILTSGTLSPLDSYASELQVQFSSTLEASHVIDPQRFRAVTVECGPSGALLDAKYKNVDLFSFQDDVGSAIASIAARSPDGMLVFVPSYSLLAKLLARWRATECLSEIEVHKRVFVEPQGGSKEDFDRLLSNYRNCLAKNRPPGCQPARRGAIMFAVYRGKVSEGIDFSDYFCRTVVNIGIPYPAFKDVKVILKREYNDARSNPKHTPPDQGLLLTGSKWYDIQAFRAINQALGRCLRHKMDWGVIFMLESRFAQPWNVERLSKWVRKHMHFYHTFEEAKLDLDAFYTARIQEDIDGDVNSILPACSSLGLESPTTPTTPTAHSVDFILN